MCALLYAPGILVYWWARSVRGEKAFNATDAIIAVGIVIAAGDCRLLDVDRSHQRTVRI